MLSLNTGTFPWHNPYNLAEFFRQLSEKTQGGAQPSPNVQAAPQPIAPAAPDAPPSPDPAPVTTDLPPGQSPGQSPILDEMLETRLNEWGSQLATSPMGAPSSAVARGALQPTSPTGGATRPAAYWNQSLWERSVNPVGSMLGPGGGVAGGLPGGSMGGGGLPYMGQPQWGYSPPPGQPWAPPTSMPSSPWSGAGGPPAPVQPPTSNTQQAWEAYYQQLDRMWLDYYRWDAQQRGQLAGGTTQLPPATSGGARSWDFQQRPFVQGWNYAWKNPGGDFGGVPGWGWGGVQSDPGGYLRDLQAMKNQGATVIRWWMFGPDLYDNGISWNGNYATGVSQKTIGDVLKALELAAQAGVQLQLTPLAHGNFAGSKNVNGYNSKSFAPIVADPGARQAWINNVMVPIYRAVQSSPYRNYLHSWDFVNEPELAVNSGEFDGGGHVYPGTSYVNMKAFIDGMAQAAAQNNPTSLRTVGGLGSKWPRVWDSPNIDFITWHYYDWNDQYFNYRNVNPRSLGINKPVVLGEWPAQGIGGQSSQALMQDLARYGFSGGFPWAFTDMGFQGRTSPIQQYQYGNPGMVMGGASSPQPQPPSGQPYQPVSFQQWASLKGYSVPQAPSALGQSSYQPVSQPQAFRATSLAQMPSWGGWAWGGPPIGAIANAGFKWFEVGYPDSVTGQDTAWLTSHGVTPFAYINMGEMVPDMRGQIGYTGPVLRTNGTWGTQIVNVLDPSWQSWLMRRVQESWQRGIRGIKFDVAEPDVPPGATRQQVTDTMGRLLGQIKARYPGMRIVLNQGWDLARRYPQYVDGIQTEGLFSASSWPSAYLKPWNDPWYWGPQYQIVKELQRMGMPVIVAEYADPRSQRGRDLYNAIVQQGLIPYITNERWQERGMGLNIQPGW